VKRCRRTRRKNISRPPITKPATGEVIIGITTLGKSPIRHFKTDQSPSAVANAAPQSPPISAWLELDGRPSSQVINFQVSAPTSAQRMAGLVHTFRSENTCPQV